jgi:hypothetical protein
MHRTILTNARESLWIRRPPTPNPDQPHRFPSASICRHLPPSASIRLRPVGAFPVRSCFLNLRDRLFQSHQPPPIQESLKIRTPPIIPSHFRVSCMPPWPLHWPLCLPPPPPLPAPPPPTLPGCRFHSTPPPASACSVSPPSPTLQRCHPESRQPIPATCCRILFLPLATAHIFAPRLAPWSRLGRLQLCVCLANSERDLSIGATGNDESESGVQFSATLRPRTPPLCCAILLPVRRAGLAWRYACYDTPFLARIIHSTWSLHAFMSSASHRIG